MERDTFLEFYRVCKRDDGTPEEIERAGETVTFKAKGIRTDNSVAVKVIPITAVDPEKREQFEEQGGAIQVLDHANIADLIAFGVEDDGFVFVSEFVSGETVESWVSAHGPMPPDAVLRVALQVVSAISAAASAGLIHRAIQPSNLIIVPDQTAEGGWPLVKLLNFMPRGLPAANSPEFTSPEQAQGELADFRSEVYSLGATICFLMTGLTAPSELRLQQAKQFPKPMRDLVVAMLQPNPGERPQDSTLLAEALRGALRKMENWQALRNRFGIPLISGSARGRSPLLRRALAIAALLLTAAAVAAVLLPEDVARKLFHRNWNAIGVPVGVPDASPENSTAIVSNPAPAASAPATSTATPAMIAEERSAEPEPPAKGPESLPETAPTIEDQQNSVAEATPVPGEPAATPVPVPPRITEARKTSPPTFSSKNARPPRISNGDSLTRSTRTTSLGRARFLGMTADGRVILGLPNGQIRIVTPAQHRGRRYNASPPSGYPGN
jgi:serine/threonine protein kinase